MKLRAALAALVVALAGCGDDGPSKEDFTKRADAICKDANAAVAPIKEQSAAAQRESDPDQVFAAMSRVTRRTADVTEPFVARLDTLETPSDDRDELKGWIADLRRQLQLVERLGRAFAGRDQQQIVMLAQQVEAIETRTNRFAASYGMRECAKRG